MFRKLFGSPPSPFMPQVAPDHRIYAIGDIHGRADLLDNLLARIANDSAARQDARAVFHVFLGDYIDRGDDSRAVLERVCALKASDPERIICLAGNHEAAMLAFLEDPVDGARWLGFGGDRTLRSYGITHDTEDLQATALELRRALGPKHAFLTGLERMWRSGDFVFVHAALDPKRPLDQQEDQNLLWGNRRFLRKGYARACVVHGHYDDPEPVLTPERICIDTGAYYSGRLTAVCLDEETRIL